MRTNNAKPLPLKSLLMLISPSLLTLLTYPPSMRTGKYSVKGFRCATRFVSCLRFCTACCSIAHFTACPCDTTCAYSVPLIPFMCGIVACVTLSASIFTCAGVPMNIHTYICNMSFSKCSLPMMRSRYNCLRLHISIILSKIFSYHSNWKVCKYVSRLAKARWSVNVIDCWCNCVKRVCSVRCSVRNLSCRSILSCSSLYNGAKCLRNISSSSKVGNIPACMCGNVSLGVSNGNSFTYRMAFKYVIKRCTSKCRYVWYWETIFPTVSQRLSSKVASTIAPLTSITVCSNVPNTCSIAVNSLYGNGFTFSLC